ncbi:MAG: LamG domain-containing protein [Candidatus Pacebacteria bacterium]|nr:LamG domain-containing protein [Candidatus Paceibacterota bacterium]
MNLWPFSNRHVHSTPRQTARWRESLVLVGIWMVSVLIRSDYAWAAEAVWNFDFDDGVQEDWKLIGNVEVVPGVVGNAVRVGEGALRKTSENFLPIQAGAVSLWIRPVNWDGTEPRVTIFLEMTKGERRYERSFIWFYRPDDTSRRGISFMINQAGMAGKTGWTGISLPYSRFKSWKRGEWHHLLVTWHRDEGTYFYMDSQMVAFYGCQHALRAPDHLYVGSRQFVKDNGPLTDVDEVRMYDELLSQQEIRNIFLQGIERDFNDVD